MPKADKKKSERSEDRPEKGKSEPPDWKALKRKNMKHDST